MNPNRRQILQCTSALGAAPWMFSRLAWAQAATDRRLVVILLRGGLDGLAAVPALGDADFERARRGLATQASDASHAALPLDGYFGLNAWLPGLHALYRAGELTVVHAVATPYRDRSHFDAQLLLENGTEQPRGTSSGWLNRALALLPAHGPNAGLSLTSALPLIASGDVPITTWSPSSLPPPALDFLERIGHVYRADPELSAMFARARMQHAAANPGNATAQGDFAVRLQAAARLLSAPNGARVAFLELHGWDSHVGQAAEHGALHVAMRSLDAGMAQLQQGLGNHWQSTVVLVVTEFGRTVALNGSNGTDHGTASVAMLAGGAVKGGRVIADWPGLKPGALLGGRDLKPTTDLRAVCKGVLHAHLGIDPDQLARRVFPGSGHVAPLTGLLRSS